MTVLGYFTDLASMFEFLFELLTVVVSVLVTVRHLSFNLFLFKIKENHVVNIIYDYYISERFCRLSLPNSDIHIIGS